MDALLLKCDPSWSPPPAPPAPPAPPPPPCPHPCPLSPPLANRSCAATVQWHAGVQLHDLHPAGDLANRGDLATPAGCAEWCCANPRCVAFFHTTNQVSATTGGCRQNGTCCWIKPTFNVSRTNDTCASQSNCNSGVLRRGLPSPLPPSLPPPKQMALVMLQNPAAKCLDGTQGAFYMSRGVGSGANSWLIFQEGKAWCLSPEQCLSRTKATDGRGGWLSSNGACLPPTLSRRGAEDYPPYGHLVNNSRQLSDDPLVNPTMWNWNVV